MPASEHMVVIEKRQDIELRLLMAGGPHDEVRGLQPRKAGKRRRLSEPRGNSPALARESKP